MHEKQTEGKPAKQQQLWLRRVAISMVVIAAFGFGMGVGNGTLSFTSRGVVSSDLPASLNYTSVNQLYQSIKENYNGKLSESQLIDGLKHGLAESTNDPYTTYFTKKEAASFNDSLNNTFSGIGAELSKDSKGNIQVISPISGTPAEKAGVKAKDIIASINDKTTVGMSVDDAVKNIRGKAGTQVKLQLIRGDAAVELKITREQIQVPSVTHKTLEGNIGYIRVSTFANDTASLIAEATNALKDSKSIILDLRNNPGGSVDAAVAVSSEWLPLDSTIMQEKRGSEVVQSYRSTGDQTVGDLPTVVLVNGGSASASEIVAAALKDNKHGYIIGEKTYGKGVVQQLINFKDGSQLKVTVADWFRPNGKNINKHGIDPDMNVKLAEDATPENDNQLQAAEAYLNR